MSAATRNRKPLDGWPADRCVRYDAVLVWARACFILVDAARVGPEIRKTDPVLATQNQSPCVDVRTDIDGRINATFEN